MLVRINGLLLVPGLSFACFGVMVLLTFKGPGVPIDPAAIARQRQVNVAIIQAVFLAGCVLLWGYWRHARNESLPGGSVLLWLLTIVYNGRSIAWLGPVQSLNPLNPFAALLVRWQLTTIILALVALGFDLRQRARSHPDAERF